MMKIIPTLPPYPEFIAAHQSHIRMASDIAVMIHLVAFIGTLVTGCVSDTLWLVASILIGCLMIMIPFVTEAVIKGVSPSAD